MASSAQPLRITWEFPIDVSEMGAISPDMENQQIKLLFASAEKADAFFRRFSLLVDEFSEASFDVQKAEKRENELTISTTGRSLFAALSSLHYTIRVGSEANYSNPYRYTLIQS